MADQICNQSKGMFVGLYERVKSNDPATSAFIWILLKTGDTDDNLRGFDDFAAMIAGASVEADFTNYARKSVIDSALAALPAADDANDKRVIDLPNVTWTAAGGASNNTMAKAILCYVADVADIAVNANLVPVAHYDFTPTTTGADLVLEVAGGGAGEAT